MRKNAIALVVAISLVFAPGCFKKKESVSFPEDAISRFPTGEELEEGDVILARSYGLIGAMFANYSQAGGKYSHGAMVYRAEDGTLMMLNYRPTGMETCRPEEFFTRYNRLALVRYSGDLNDAVAPAYVGSVRELRGKEALSATSCYWLGKNREKRIPPDYRLDHDEHTYMFCLELTSTVYRDCGLPDPFFKAKKANEDPLLITANKLFKADVIEVRSPSSALDNPQFHQIADWIRPEYDLREETLNEELMRIAVRDIEQGYRPKRPPFGNRMKIRQIFALYRIATAVAFWLPKQDLPDFIDVEVVNNAFMFYTYISKSKKMAKHCIGEQTLPVFVIDEDREIWLSEVRRLVRIATDIHRDTYMHKVAEPFVNGEAPPIITSSN